MNCSSGLPGSVMTQQHTLAIFILLHHIFFLPFFCIHYVRSRTFSTWDLSFGMQHQSVLQLKLDLLHFSWAHQFYEMPFLSLQLAPAPLFEISYSPNWCVLTYPYCYVCRVNTSNSHLRTHSSQILAPFKLPTFPIFPSACQCLYDSAWVQGF